MAVFSMSERARYSAEDYASASIETQDKILRRQAAIIIPAQEKNARSLLNERGQSVGITSRSIVAKNPTTASGGFRVLSITFRGTRPNGSKRKRTAEVAFLNEFGVASKGMNSRRFIEKSNEESADECAELAADLFVEYVDSLLEI